MKKTKYNIEEVNVKATIICLIIAICMLIFLGIVFYKTLTLPAESNIMKIETLFVTGFIFVFIMSGLMSTATGIFKAKMNMLQGRQKIQKGNPYLYYRELPNEYGIGIATILIDSTIENEKDIIAVILDLCAKGYLHLNKKDDEYEISVLKTIDDKLLANEKYIMYLITNNDIKNINYNEWFNYCMQDGIKLGLFKKKEKLKSNRENFQERTTKIKKISKVYRDVTLILSAIITITLLVTKDGEGATYLPIGAAIPVFLIASLLLFIVLYTPLYLIPVMFVSLTSVSKQAKEQAYNLEILNNIEPTKDGEIEIQKLRAFKAFIKDFGMFADRNPEEIVLWEYYLSYAQVFGLTKEILATGYKKIIQNASFEVGNIDLIRLNQINLKQ